jgi:uncharacterized protein
MKTDRIKTKPFIIALAAVIFVESITDIVLSKTGYNIMLITIFMRFFEIVLLLGILKIWANGFCSVGLEKERITFGMRTGLIWSFNFGVIAFFVFIFLYFIGINPLYLIHTDMPSKPDQLFYYLFAGIIAGPLAEEIFFRGIIFGFLRTWGLWIAIFFSTAIFVGLHSTGSRFPLPQLAGSVVFALAYEKQKSLISPIIIHCLGNAAIFAIALLK